jgi:hypothetical protein
MHTQYLLIFAGVLGTLMNIASFFQIKYTSALTHNVSGTAKSCVQSILAWFIYQYVQRLAKLTRKIPYPNFLRIGLIIFFMV